MDFPIDFAKFFPLLFIPFWFFVVGLISLTGGWRKLSETYSPSDTFISSNAEKFSFQTVFLGLMAQYKNSINVYLTEDGIWLKPVWLFTFMHKPLFIQYQMMSEPKARKLVFFFGIEFHLTGKRVLIYGRSAEAIKARLFKRGQKIEN